MIYAIVYGKGHGCSKCDALKRRLASLIKDGKYNGVDVKVVFNDILTEDGMVQFLKSEVVNANRIPALIMANDEGFLPDLREGINQFDNSTLPGILGVQTNYDAGGLITPPMITSLLDNAIKGC